MTLREQLLSVATAFADHEGIPLGTLSSRLFNDGKKLLTLIDNGDLTTGRFERGMLWLSDHWPEGKTWPAGVPRPAATTAIKAQLSASAGAA